MKKFLKWVGIVFGVMLVLGVIGNMMGETDKPKEVAKVEQVKVDKKEDEAAKKKEAEEEAKVKAEAEKVRKEEEAKKKAEEEKAKKIAAEEAINLGMDSLTFENNWGTLSGDVDGNMLLLNPEFKTGTVKDTKSYDLTDNAVVVTTLHKGNHMIKDVTVIVMPSDDDTTNAQSILAFALAIGSTNMDLIPSERGEIFSSLVSQNPNFEEKNVYYEKDGIKYGLLISNETGMWLNITPEATVVN